MKCWRTCGPRLAGGLKDRHSTFHTPTLVTSADGWPEPRTVVLRLADESTRTLGCHTRLDAAKAGQIRRSPRVAWHVYDRTLKLQVVLRGEATVSTDDDLAEARWRATGHGSRACYRREPRSGVEVSGWQASERGDGRDRFAVVRSVIFEIDWLHPALSGPPAMAADPPVWKLAGRAGRPVNHNRLKKQGRAFPGCGGCGRVRSEPPCSRSCHNKVRGLRPKTVERRLNVLLVEDNDVERAQHPARLPAGPAGITTSSSSIRRTRPSPCWRDEDAERVLPHNRRLILLDLNLPGMSGFEFLRRLRGDADLVSTPVVILTSSDIDRDKVEAYRFNVAGYLIKPVGAGGVLQARPGARRLLDHQRVPASAVR